VKLKPAVRTTLARHHALASRWSLVSTRGALLVSRDGLCINNHDPANKNNNNNSREPKPRLVHAQVLMASSSLIMGLGERIKHAGKDGPVHRGADAFLSWNLT
jgi:predicted regulator of Ras-like GTPase activity (Roadblock/LC7/MglB family)